LATRFIDRRRSSLILRVRPSPLQKKESEARSVGPAPLQCHLKSIRRTIEASPAPARLKGKSDRAVPLV
jgi:hypothetical protein